VIAPYGEAATGRERDFDEQIFTFNGKNAAYLVVSEVATGKALIFFVAKVEKLTKAAT